LRSLNRQTGSSNLKIHTAKVSAQHPQQSPLPRQRLRPSPQSHHGHNAIASRCWLRVECGVAWVLDGRLSEILL
jgi:hypothetical protein